MNRRLLVATKNEGKRRELSALLADLPLHLIDLNSFQGVRSIHETGNSFTENARLKAAGYAQQTRLLTLADDSGLEVDALDGAPGAWSARYAGLDASDSDRIRKLLADLSSVPDPLRIARFVSVIAIADENGEIINLSCGSCQGRVARVAKGSDGFGYDPIFVPRGHDKTFGELASDVKNRISHRAKALAKARAFLLSLTRDQSAR